MSQESATIQSKSEGISKLEELLKMDDLSGDFRKRFEEDLRVAREMLRRSEADKAIPCGITKLIGDSLKFPRDTIVFGESDRSEEKHHTCITVDKARGQNSEYGKALEEALSQRDAARIALGDNVLKSANMIAELKQEVSDLKAAFKASEYVVSILIKNIDALEDEVGRVTGSPGVKPEETVWHQPNPLPRGMR